MKYINILIPILLISCSVIEPETKKDESTLDITYLKVGEQVINENDSELTIKNGVIYYQNTSYTGWVNRYSLDSFLISKTGYYDGLKEDTLYKYYPSGKIAEKRPYHKGKKHGYHQGWFGNGVLRYNYYFVNGLTEGIQKQWHSSGKRATTKNYKDGKMFGLQQGRLKNGKIRFNYFIAENGRKYGLMGVNNCISVELELDNNSKDE